MKYLLILTLLLFACGKQASVGPIIPKTEPDVSDSLHELIYGYWEGAKEGATIELSYDFKKDSTFIRNSVPIVEDWPGLDLPGSVYKSKFAFDVETATVSIFDRYTLDTNLTIGTIKVAGLFETGSTFTAPYTTEPGDIWTFTKTIDY